MLLPGNLAEAFIVRQNVHEAQAVPGSLKDWMET
jgi:hypothetical protein